MKVLLLLLLLLLLGPRSSPARKQGSGGDEVVAEIWSDVVGGWRLGTNQA